MAESEPDRSTDHFHARSPTAFCKGTKHCAVLPEPNYYPSLCLSEPHASIRVPQTAAMFLLLYASPQQTAPKAWVPGNYIGEHMCPILFVQSPVISHDSTQQRVQEPAELKVLPEHVVINH